MTMCDPLNCLGSIWLKNIHEINKCGGGIFFGGGWNFSKSVSVDSTFIRDEITYIPFCAYIIKVLPLNGYCISGGISVFH